MKKYLPKLVNSSELLVSSKNKRSTNYELRTTNSFGYTLIELLVVITIMAVLAVIGISLYTNAQRNARDGIRKSEISGLAKSIETTKDPASSDYKYSDTNYTDDYAQNKPQDPLKLTTPLYCIATGAEAAVIPAPNVANWSGACPSESAGGAGTGAYTAWATIAGVNGAYGTANNALHTSSAKRWMICAKPEAGTTAICVKSMR